MFVEKPRWRWVGGAFLCTLLEIAKHLNVMGAYSSEDKQTREFVCKTLRIIKQYDEYGISAGSDKFDVTLRINCLIGLVIIPQQYFNSINPAPVLPIAKQDEPKWGVQMDSVNYGRNNSESQEWRNNMHRIAKHIRNSVAHNNRFKLKSYGALDITHVHFMDYRHKTETIEEKTFDYEFEVDNLYRFANKYAEFFLAL